MKIGIVGSRRWKDKKAIKRLIMSLPKDSTVISGGCKGVDSWAAEIARNRDLEVVEFLPDLPSESSEYWKFARAYYNRNRLIAEASDILHAFVAPDRKGGTENTISCMKSLKKPVIIHKEG